MQSIEKGKKYKIKPCGEYSKSYFLTKYGTQYPEIEIEGRDTYLFHGETWEYQKGNVACFIFGSRIRIDLTRKDYEEKTTGSVYGGKIDNRSELVLKEELEEIE